MTSRTASAAAQATGLPPKVVPWLPGWSRCAASPEAEAGTDRDAAAEALGQGDDVGRTGSPRPGRWANQAPVRPMPVCTSSSHSSAPWSSAIRAGGREVAAGGTTTPASPWIGSSTTAAVSSVTAAASAAASPYGTKVTSPGSGSNGAR